MSEESLKELIKKRGVIKGKITIFSNYVVKVQQSVLNKEEIPEPKIIELEERIYKNDGLSCELDAIQSQIEMEVMEDEPKLAEQLNQRQEILQTFYDSLSVAKHLLKQLKHNNDLSDIQSRASSKASSHSNCGMHSTTAVKLPDIKLPIFNGSTETWLEASLEGSASEVIKSLEIAASNYNVAWELLCKRFDNKELLIHSHLDALFNLEKISKVSSFKLRKVSDTVAKHLRALNVLELPTNQWDILILYLVAKSLDDASIIKWEEFKIKKGLPSLEDMYQFLQKRADVLERLEFNKLDRGHMPVKTRGLISASDSDNIKLNNSSATKLKCAICQGKHKNFLCDKFKAMSVSDRIEQVKKLKLCQNCLRAGHKINQCKLYALCKTCRAKHNTLLHQEVTNDNIYQREVQANSDEVSLSSNSESCQTLLSTAVIDVLDSNGTYQLVRAILDSGSMSSFITEELCSKLRLPKQNINFAVSGLNSAVCRVNFKCQVTFKSRYNKFKTDLYCLVLPEITGHLPTISLNKQQLSIPKNLQLADENFDSPGPIQMLIGADIFWNLLGNRQFSLGVNRPVLQETQLGWLVSGKIGTIQNFNNTFCNFVKNEAHINVQDQLAEFFKLEDVKPASPWSIEETECENYFQKTTKRMPDGRFEVSIPLKLGTEALGDSLKVAQKRFYSLEHKFKTDQRFCDMYKHFINEYENLGHMKRLGEVSDIKDNGYYLPHHGILREHSTTTKLRTVFDASARTSSGISFNDLQMIGPVIQDDLMSILLRFRQHKYVVTADIEKMYRQILVSADQHRFQRILWRSQESQNLSVFELATVTYGTTSAPFLAVRSLVELGNSCKDQMPNISEIILHDFYVDDLLTGFDDLELAKGSCLQIQDVLLSGCFPLRKWRSNFPELLSRLKFPNSVEHSEALVIGEDDVSKTLGLKWLSNTDKLTFCIDIVNEKPLTKRVMLSCISKIFDPLGLVSPSVVIAKVMLQKLWQENLSWDSSVPYELQIKWNLFLQELPCLKDIRIIRHVICDNFIRIDLHAFSDASEIAYGAAVYVRSENSDGEIYCHLLTSKAKVAPIKPLTTPRLELCAAHLMAKLVTKVVRSLRLEFSTLNYWSDSKIILGWIQTSVNLLKPFVRNRVAEIQDLTEISSWRHVPTSQNPADILSRGLSPASLAESNMWWHGPQWLRENHEFWATDNKSILIELPELKPTSLITVHQFEFRFQKFSKLIRLKRCMAYILRFINNCIKSNESRVFGVLTAEELNEASKKLVTLSQKTSFANEYNDLLVGKNIDRKSKLLALNPFMDSDGIIRVGGRLNNSDFSYDKKHPMLLSSKHPLTTLIFQQEHENLLHAGPQQLLFSIRETFWPVAARNLAKSIVHKCTKCFRFKPKGVQPIMGNLPANRFISGFPFKITGIDYAGPFLILNRRGRGSKLLKGYVCLFVCFATKAIHLELVNNLSTESFLLAFKRFISRRGKPAQVYTDHGTNFIGANRELKQLYKFLKESESAISDFVNNEGIAWHFNPVQAPHFGGLWEAGVKAMKHHLKRVTANAKFTSDEFSTLLCQIEAILNSRPLSPLSTDPLDPSPLTPAHFIIGRPLTSILEPDYSLQKESKLSRYQKMENARQHFWSRWYKEFISDLQHRTKWKVQSNNLKEGTLVIVKDDKLHPLNWRLGRITKLFFGTDNISRVAEVSTNTGTITRDFSKLCPLPISDVTC